MSKMPMAHRFRAWLLSVWFGSFEGGMVRDAWRKKFTSQERERIIKLLEERINAYYKTGAGSSIETAAYEKVIALIKGENNDGTN